MKRVFVALVVGLCFLTALSNASAQLLGATGGSSNGSLYSINPNTGAGTLVGALVDGSAGHYAVTGLALDTVTGVLYGSTSVNSPTGSRSLVSINPATGFVTFIGNYNEASNTMGDLTFDATTNTLYGTGSVTGDLYVVDLTSGNANDVGSSGLSNIQGVGVATNSLGGIIGAPTGASSNLVAYSKSNGSVTPISTLSGAPFSNSINALAFNSVDTLYGVNINTSDPARATHLVTINVGTGAVHDVGLSVNNLDALVFIPEPGTVMLLGMGLCFLGINLRRRYPTRRNWK